MKTDNIPLKLFIKLMVAVAVLVIGGAFSGYVNGMQEIYLSSEVVKGSITLYRNLTVRTVNKDYSTDLTETNLPHEGTAVIPGGTTGEYSINVYYHMADKSKEPLTTVSVEFPSLKDWEGSGVYVYITRKSFEELQKDKNLDNGSLITAYVIESVEGDEYQHIFDEYNKTVEKCRKVKWEVPKKGLIKGLLITLAAGVVIFFTCRFADNKTLAEVLMLLTLVAGIFMILSSLGYSTFLTHY